MKRTLARAVDGVIVIDKEREWTSHDVCAFIRDRFRIQKVGHAGTLDPQATGVLVVLLGRATKRSQEFSSCDKEYVGTLRLGAQTDTHDSSGNVVSRGEWRTLKTQTIREVFSRYTGVLTQTPPMVSALKQNGVRLYQLARRGKTVERPRRQITVHELRIEGIVLPEIRFFARVSKGTYLRTLANDIGEDLGCFAALSELRRLRSGDFTLSEAVTTSELKRTDFERFMSFVRDPVHAGAG